MAHPIKLDHPLSLWTSPSDFADDPEIKMEEKWAIETNERAETL